MAITAISRPASTGATFTAKISNLFYRATAAISDWNIERKTVSELSKLSDHELDDIGLSRGQIREMVKHH